MPPTTTTPTDAFVQNGWYIDHASFTSPHFSKLSGLGRKTGTVNIVDGGTNVQYKFSNQVKDFGQIQLVRAMDGSEDDTKARALADAGILEGTKSTFSLVKLHHGVEVFRIAFTGARVAEENWDDFDTEGSDRLNITYVFDIDEWEYEL